MDTGFQYVQGKIQAFTTEPGCYLMKDTHGEIFYIGKANNLRARLKSYLKGRDTRIFVQYLEHILADIEVVVVRNDIEALLLERELIKKHRPRFNIMLKDDKNYLLLKLRRPKASLKKKDLYPRLEIVRKAKKDNARYFGPYPSAGRLRMVVDLINKYFMLRTCTDLVIDNRARPCIQYQIGRCPAPCVIDVPDYGQEVDNAELFLSGNYREIEKRLNAKMWALSEQEHFERAAFVRNQLEAIKTSLTIQVVSEMNRARDQDIIGLLRHGPEVEIVVIEIRRGTWHKSHNYAFNDQPFPSEEVLRSFMDQAYANKLSEEIPHDILISLPITRELFGLQQELSLRASHKVHITAPTKGKQKRLVEIALKNARLALDERIKQHNASEQALLLLQNKLGLAIKPSRIECIDISLIQGQEPYGSLVVFVDGQPDKSRYRLYKIKTVSGMDDFAMIFEVVFRRMKNAIEESDMPDLLLIDGGKGQLNAALKAIEQSNVLVSKSGLYVAGIAKARTIKETSALNGVVVEHSSERLFVPEQPEPIILEPHTFDRYLIERIRDEAHRFAISAHRRGRKKRTLQSELLSVPGIGKTRAIALLKHFGSVKSIKTATAEEIAAVIRVNTKAAEKILSSLLLDENTSAT